MARTDEQVPVLYDPYARRDSMDDEFVLRDLWRIVRKYRWLIGSVVVVSVIAAAVVTLMTRPVYRSSVIVEVTPNEQLVEFDNVARRRIDERSYLSAQQAVMESRNVALSVIDALDLENDPEINGQLTQRGLGTVYGAVKSLVRSAWASLSEGSAVAGDVDTQRDGAPNEEAREPGGSYDEKGQAVSYQTEAVDDKHVRRYLDRVSVERVGGANLLRMNVDSFDPQKATQMAETHLNAYLQESRRRRFESTSAAKQFLQRQLVQAERNLEESEHALNQFARKYNIVDIEDYSNVLEVRLESLNGALTAARQDRIKIGAQYEEAKKGDIEALPAILDSGLLSKMREDYVALRAEYRKLGTFFTDNYPQMQQLQSKLQDLKASLNEESRSVLEKLNTQRLQLMSEEKELARQIEEQRSKLLDLKDHTVSFNTLKREWEANKQLYGGLLDKLKDISVVNGMELNAVSVVDRKPAIKRYPDTRKHIAFGGALGVFGGLGIAFLLAFMDNTFKTRRELVRALGFPYLGFIPEIPRRDRSGIVNMGLVVEYEPRSAMADAMRSIRTTLLFSQRESSPKKILVTSTTSGEGKSVIASNLALSLARHKKRVLLVETDLRRPTLSACFNVESTPGLAEYLTGRSSNVVKETGFENVFCIPAGGEVDCSTDLLASERMDDYLEALSCEFDFVILDGMPVMGLADSLILSADKVDGVVFVVKAGSTNKDAVEESAERLRSIRANVIGTVLNCVDTDQQEYFYYMNTYSRYGMQHGQKSIENRSQA